MKNLTIAILLIFVVFLGYKALVKPSAVEAPTHEEVKSEDLSLQPLPATCVSVEEGVPVITSLSSYSLSSTGVFEVRGCNFSGFEGDKDVWIENGAGVKGYLLGTHGSSNERIELILKPKLCQQNNNYSGLDCTTWLDLVPGVYRIYASSWGKDSNKVLFEIK